MGELPPAADEPPLLVLHGGPGFAHDYPILLDVSDGRLLRGQGGAIGAV